MSKEIQLPQNIVDSINKIPFSFIYDSQYDKEGKGSTLGDVKVLNPAILTLMSFVGDNLDFIFSNMNTKKAKKLGNILTNFYTGINEERFSPYWLCIGRGQRRDTPQKERRITQPYGIYHVVGENEYAIGTNFLLHTKYKGSYGEIPENYLFLDNISFFEKGVPYGYEVDSGEIALYSKKADQLVFDKDINIKESYYLKPNNQDGTDISSHINADQIVRDLISQGISYQAFSLLFASLERLPTLSSTTPNKKGTS